MKHSRLFQACLLALSLFLITSCHSSKKESTKIDQGFKEYISAFTSGQIPSRGTVMVKLSPQFKQEVTPNTKIDESLFTFQPQIKGSAIWKDARTIIFTPENPLPSGTTYDGKFSLGKLIETRASLKEFPLKFQVIKQSFQVQEGELKPSEQEPTCYNYTSTIVTADIMEDDVCKQLISIQAEGQNPKISWLHNKLSNKHTFTIENIERKEDDSHIKISWDGKAQNIDLKGESEVKIPGLNNFSLVNAQVIHQPVQYVLLTFSDPLKKPQNLKGLIRVENTDILRYIIDNNQVKVYLNKRTSGEKKVSIEKSITNASNYKLKKAIVKHLTFAASKPNVRLMGKGVIIPETDGLIFPFEAINLKSIDVSVVKIYENNISQFLQINNLDQEQYIRRVGRLILRKKIDLIGEDVIDYGKWNGFSLDLKELVETEPGAIYQIKLSFRKSYSLYPCEGEDDEESTLEDEVNWDEEFNQEQSYWDNGAYYYGYNNYNWRDRENPCTPSYYHNKSVTRNVLASNLGIIAKAGDTKEINVTVTDILSANALSNVKVEILDYQQQVINSGVTDEDGQVTLDFDHKPYLLVAKHNNQFGYLKLNDGLSLSLSKFDVSGAKIEKGIKGFIYGERGVWRPGDDIYLTFILEDKENTLPDNHPIVFELINPQGKTTDTQVKASGVGNFYHFRTKTNDDAPTGNWTAKIKVGGATFHQRVKVETVKPNRLKIKLEFNKDVIRKDDKDLQGDLEVKWLHGAIAKNLKADIYMQLSKAKTQFETHRDYIFDDPSLEFQTYEQKVFDGKVDEKGKAKINPKIDLKGQLPGMMTARFNTKAYEQGGNFSVNQKTIPYAPYSSYVGIKTPKGDKARGMLLTDVKHKIEVVTVNADGEKISLIGLKAKLYKIQWRWWWQAGSDNIGNYISRQNLRPILSREFSTKDGYGSFDIEVKYPDWGRYLLKVENPNGQSTGKTIYIDWPGWAGRAQGDNPGGASMLLFSADKKNYTVGETAKITFPSSEGGRALVSLEKGSKVLESYWVNTQKDETPFEFVISEDMAPNIYVNITLLQAYKNTANDLPLRLYGVIPLMVENPATRLQPVIEMKDELKPESKVAIKVKEENGEAMTFTLAVVDDGLLDLTNHTTPNPWNTFYAREALGVKTWDLYDYVLGAYGAKIEAAFAIGGDGDLNKNKDRKAQRFKPVAKFFGPYHLPKGEEKEFSFDMPRYIGSVRTMVIAGNDVAYGMAEKTTPVKNPLMLLGTLPRVISPEEELALPVTLFALSDNIKDVEVSIETNDKIIVQDSKTKTLNFSSPGEKDFNFNIKVGRQLGIGTVKLTAKAGNIEASYDLEIDVRAPNPQKTVSHTMAIAPGEEWVQDFSIFGIDGTNTATIEISGIPPINLDKRLKYLIRYPYGCIEQTTSAAFPQLYLSHLVELSDEAKMRISQNVKETLNRYQSFQLSNGAFSYWPGKGTASLWGTNYAGHFMIEAEEKGFTLPSGMKQSWLSYQIDASNQWSPNTQNYRRTELTQAYRLYVLARSGNANLGAMNRLREQETKYKETNYLLAASYALIGNNEVALALIQEDLPESEKSNYYYSYGSSLRNKALILESLLEIKDFNKAMPYIKAISDQLNSNRWYSTQTTAFCLKTMAKAGQNLSSELDQILYSYAFDEEKPKEAMLTKAIKQHESHLDATKANRSIKVKNLSSQPFFANLSIDGIPLIDSVATTQENLSLKVVYKDLNDKVLDPKRIAQGTDFKAEISVYHPGLLPHYKDLALTMMTPSGWEIINTRLSGETNSHVKDSPDYLDIRDDRVNLFFDLNKKHSKTFVILLNASYLGQYYLPAITCSEMYNKSIQARIKGRKTEVYKPGN